MPPATFRALPFEILRHVCDVLSARSDPSSLLNLMRTSAQLYDVVSPLIYNTAYLNSRNIRAFFRGLDPACIDDIWLPPVSIPLRRDPTHSLYHASPTSESRKACLLGLIRHVDISEDLSEDRCPRDIFAQYGIHQLKIRRLPFLDWALGCATTYSVRLLPSLRQLTYHERIVPMPVNAFECEELHQRQRSTDAVRAVTIRLEPADSCISAEARSQWDICIRTSVVDHPAFPHQTFGGWAVHSWLMDLTTGNNTSIHNLAVHSDDPHVMQGLSLLDLSGVLRLYIRQPAKASNSKIVCVDRSGSGRLDAVAREFITVLADLFQSAQYGTQHEARIKVYHAFQFDKCDLGVLREKVSCALRKLPNRQLRVEKEASGASVLSDAYAKNKGRELWLAGSSMKESRCICKVKSRG